MAECTPEYPSASVVIPSFNRLATLRRVIEAVRDQDRPATARVEIVVVDDGSSDGTWEWLRSLPSHWGVIRLRQENAGPARARNRGAAAANGQVVLFIGDDTVPGQGWLTAHLEEHRLHGFARPLAVVGYTSFPSPESSPFLRWINEFGAQFGYALIDTAGEVPFNFFYTSNISLPREVFLELNGFREDFPAAAWEDIEFAYRASAQGLRLRYQPRARVVHEHRIRPRTFCRRQRTSGRSAAIFAQHHPDLADFLGLNSLAEMARWGRGRQLLDRLLVWMGEGIPGLVSGEVYERFLRAPYLQGLAEGLQEQGRR
jgi:GT2 family glycosyltransferase